MNVIIICVPAGLAIVKEDGTVICPHRRDRPKLLNKNVYITMQTSYHTSSIMLMSGACEDPFDPVLPPGITV
jgi:hypothetical protein